MCLSSAGGEHRASLWPSGQSETSHGAPCGPHPEHRGPPQASKPSWHLTSETWPLNHYPKARWPVTPAITDVVWPLDKLLNAHKAHKSCTGNGRGVDNQEQDDVLELLTLGRNVFGSVDTWLWKHCVNIIMEVPSFYVFVLMLLLVFYISLCANEMSLSYRNKMHKQYMWQWNCIGV